MVVQASSIGLSQDEFWRMTTRELFRAFAAARRRKRDQYEHATVIAYQTVKVWVMTKSKKRMPTFESLLPKEHKDIRQSAEEMKAAMELIAGQYGNKVRRLERSSR